MAYAGRGCLSDSGLEEAAFWAPLTPSLVLRHRKGQLLFLSKSFDTSGRLLFIEEKRTTPNF